MRSFFGLTSKCVASFTGSKPEQGLSCVLNAKKRPWPRATVMAQRQKLRVTAQTPSWGIISQYSIGHDADQLVQPGTKIYVGFCPSQLCLEVVSWNNLTSGLNDYCKQKKTPQIVCAVLDSWGLLFLNSCHIVRRPDARWTALCHCCWRIFILYPGA